MKKDRVAVGGAASFLDSPNTLYVFGHGNSRIMADDRGLIRRRLSAEDLADVIRSESSRAGTNVVLVGCETGKGDGSIAERLSKILGEPVTGYTDKIIVFGGRAIPGDSRTF